MKNTAIDPEANSIDEGVQAHSLLAKTVHWSFTLLFIFALFKQLDELEELEDFALLQFEMAFATLFLFLLLARFFFMRATQPTALPGTAPRLNRFLARAGHLAIYISLATVALSGLAIGGLYWLGSKEGLAIQIALGVHEVSVNLSYLFVLGHVGAALYHRHERTGVWNAMVPFWKEPGVHGALSSEVNSDPS